ncbi:hypothetical protein EG68_01534 [Paragonimus skrjabini miyazakii]|uniref:RRM domain-containing protein n=1 Tax=Paragonimus skrjabini miyazakii TaxID=59628 RepID=A0A8S9Z7A9_9TREM|nr:hypothetical protein EG68_01534 [Paragonimus skrjabini miyazakii]
MTDAEGNEIGKLFVGGLSQATNNGSLRLYFSRFGEVDDAVVMMDNKTGRSRGFGYVKYREPDSVKLALEAKPHILDGKEVDAKQCNVNMKGRNRRSLKIFVGGIGLEQDAESIKNYFRQFGRVTDVNLMMDSNKQRHRGFAFVGFEDESVVKRLISIHYVTMNNKQVEIKAMEPPNFGRKIGSTACVTTAAIMASTNPAENACTHTFEHTGEPTGLFTNGVAGFTTSGSYGSNHTYLPTQAPNLHCLQHNILGQSGASPVNVYEAHTHGTFATNLIPDNLYQPTAFMQPMSPTECTATRAPAETVLPAANSYISSKQAMPLLVTNGPLQPSAALQPGTYNTTASSIYATIPCQLVPSTFISQSQQSVAAPATMNGVGQLMSADKTGLTGWSTATHLAICAPQVGSQTSLVPFPPFATTQPIASNGLLNPNPNNSSTGSGSILTPYYTLCPQYTSTTVQIQPDQTNSVQYRTGHSIQVSSGVINSCGLSSAPEPGAGDATTLPVNCTNSRTTSPTDESKSESMMHLMQNAPTSAKLIYPTMLMTPTNGLTSPAVVASATASVNAGQPMWNPSTPNLVYSPLPVGWAIHPHTTHIGATHQPQWSSTVTMMQPQLSSVANNTNSATKTKLPTSVGQTGESGRDQTCGGGAIKEMTMESTQVTPTKASGDSLDNLVLIGEHNSTAYANNEFSTSEDVNNPSAYRNMKSQSEIKEVQQPGSQLTELTAWQINSTNANSVSGGGQYSAVTTTALPSWNGPTAVGNLSGSRWSEVQQTSSNFTGQPNVVLHPHAWTLPLELTDDTLPRYELTASTNAIQRRAGTVAQPAGVHGANCQHETLMKSSYETSKCESNTQTPVSISYSRAPQRTAQYQQQQQSVSHIQPSSNRPNKSSGESMETQVINTSTCGSVLTSEMTNSQEGSARLDYSAWLYPNTSCSGHLDNATGGDGKDVRVNPNVGVDMECQGPAGAAGDFHRPIHTGRYSTYHMTTTLD